VHRHITRVDVTLPEDWLPWAPRGGTDAIDQLLTAIGATGSDRARGARELHDVERSLVPGVRYAAVGAWAPGRSGTGRVVLATVVVEHLAGTRPTIDPVGDHLHRTRRAITYGTSRGRIRYHGTAIAVLGGLPAVRTRRSLPAGLPAGPAGVPTAATLLGPAREEVLYSVFPDDSLDAVELRIGSTDEAGLDLAEGCVEALAAGIVVRLDAR
jgi:hypothetical protein